MTMLVTFLLLEAEIPVVAVRVHNSKMSIDVEKCARRQVQV
jgi:hypothetical protein